MAKKSVVRDSNGKATHIRETSNDGRTSVLREYDNSTAAHITGSHAGKRVEISTHDRNGNTRAYEYDNGIAAHITGDHRGKKK